MRRFFFLSLFLHGIVLMLLFSWEIPLADKIAPRNIIQVSLVEKGEEETPPVQFEKKSEEPKKRKRFVKEKIAPPVEPKQAKKEIQKEDLQEEEKPKEEEPRIGPEKPAEKPELHPEAPRQQEARPSQNQEAKTAGGAAGEEKSKSDFPAGGGAFLEASLNFDAGNEGIPIGGGEKQTGVPEGAGRSFEMKAPGPSLPEVDSVLSQIMRRIEAAKRYPRAARRMGIEGKTVVRFKLRPGGQVEAVEVSESSGSDILDKASLETVREAAPLPYKEGWLKVGIVFKIL